MKERGVIKEAEIDYPLLKQTVEIKLEEGDERYIREMIDKIYKIVDNSTIPEAKNIKICKN